MNEEEWLAAIDLRAMLQWATPKLTERKLRLLACAWCRLGWPHLADARSRQALAYAENLAEDHHARWLPEIRKGACQAMLDASGALVRVSRSEDLCPVRRAACETLLGAEAAYGVTRLGGGDAAWRVAGVVGNGASDRGLMCIGVLRDVIGSPFRKAIRPACLTPTVFSLARAAYNERDMPSGELDPSRLAVLSDALEEAGCDDEPILSHLRGAGPHVRGCWAVDLVLGRE